MKSIKDIAYNFLKEKEVASFKQIWDASAKELKSYWKVESSDLSVPELEKVKMGELYTMLTTNGEFIRNKDEKWTLAEFYPFSEVQKMKINAVELMVED